jgi:signal transduction histidine kinase
MLTLFSRILSWPFAGSSSKSKGKRNLEQRKEESREQPGSHQHKRARLQYSENKPNSNLSSKRALFQTTDHLNRTELSSCTYSNTPQYNMQSHRSQDEMVPISKAFLNPSQLEASNKDNRKTTVMNSLLDLRSKAGSLRSPGNLLRSPAPQADLYGGIAAARVPAAEEFGYHYAAHINEEAELMIKRKQQLAEANRQKEEDDERKRIAEAERKIAE